MPRDTNGNYSLPSGTLVNSGDTILVSQHNPAMSDIAQALSNSLDRNGTGGMRNNLPMNGFRATNMAPGVAPNDAVTVAQAGALGVPISTILDYAGNNLPATYEWCFGQAVSRAAYAELFAEIGTTYGAGDGVTTFNLPDGRDVVMVGRGNMGGTLRGLLSNFTSTIMGALFGTQSVALTEAQLAAHTHGGTTAVDGNHTHNVNVFLGSPSGGQQGAPIDFGTLGGGVSTAAAGNHTHSFTTNAAGGGAAHPNVQPTLVVNKIIKARLN